MINKKGLVERQVSFLGEYILDVMAQSYEKAAKI